MGDAEFASAGGLPALLAEYGQRVVELGSTADPQRAQQLRQRLAELDGAIDEWAAALNTARL